MFVTILGFVAAALTTVSFVPQAVKILRTRDTKNISLYMYICSVVGVSCWLAYGILIRNYVIISANAVTLVLGAFILIFKIIGVAKGEKP